MPNPTPIPSVERILTSDEHLDHAPWQQILRDAIKDTSELAEVLGLDEDWMAENGLIDSNFPLLAPRGFVERMEYGNPNDPLLQQILPLREELATESGFSKDPVDDSQYVVGAGLIYKYKTRALLISTGACPVHCRYCFRRHFPYQSEQSRQSTWPQALRWLEDNEQVTEVILSGGDPLSLSNQKLLDLLRPLSLLKHVKTLRIHSRFPVVIPERVDLGLIETLKLWPGQTVVVLHSNHAREIDGKVARATARLKDAGITLLNQSVLLKGINDRIDTLARLSERLFEVGVLPYYLNKLDKVQGAAHFDISTADALALYRGLQAELPGYLLPKFVQDQPGQTGKTVLG